MNNYDLSKVDSERPQQNESPYMSFGGPQVLKINNIELKYSQSSNSPKAILHMETKPIVDPNFTPIEGAKGKVGKVAAAAVYMNSDLLKKEFLQKMKTIAVALDIEKEINSIKSEDFGDVVKKISDLFKGRYATYTIFASEYQKPDNKIGITLVLPKFKFIEPENAEPSTVTIFDKNNSYHYKKMNSQNTGSYGNYVSAKQSKWDSSPVPDNSNDPAVQDLPF